MTWSTTCENFETNSSSSVSTLPVTARKGESNQRTVILDPSSFLTYSPAKSFASMRFDGKREVVLFVSSGRSREQMCIIFVHPFFILFAA